MTPKGIIFDLDGTLIDSVADICAFSNQVLIEHGYPTHSLDKYIDWIGDGARKLIERACPKDIDANTFEQIFAKYLHIYEHNNHTESNLYEGIAELLDHLSASKVPMAILTNKPHKVMLKTIASYFQKWEFVAVEGQQDGKPKKPDPTGALEIANLMQLQPSEMVFIGDSAVDVKTGNAAGMTSICIMDGYETRQNILDAQPNIMVEKHIELLSILKN
jgi:phosphoglycolate phosphatase